MVDNIIIKLKEVVKVLFNIYTDDSNIAKAAVLEGKCQLGQEKIVGIKMIEGKSSYSSASRYGVSSVTYGSWPASYIFTDDV